MCNYTCLRQVVNIIISHGDFKLEELLKGIIKSIDSYELFEVESLFIYLRREFNFIAIFLS